MCCRCLEGLLTQTYPAVCVCLCLKRYQETSMCRHTVLQRSPKALTWPTPSTSWPLERSYRSLKIHFEKKRKCAQIVSAVWTLNAHVLTSLFVTQVQKVQGAFNALGGADRLASNRTYARGTFTHRSRYVTFMWGCLLTQSDGNEVRLLADCYCMQTKWKHDSLQLTLHLRWKLSSWLRH